MTELVQRIENYISGLEVNFKSVQVEDSIEFASEALFAKQALLNNNYLLQTAKNKPESLKNSILNIAAIGLTLNPVQQYAYLVPRDNKVCLDISYKGLIRAATDSGSILWAQSELVYEKDEFSMNGVGEKPLHKFNPFNSERGKIVGCYVVAKTFEGDYLTTAMPINEIYEIRNKSESWKSEKGRRYSPWFNFEGEMIKKTVIKRASKLWPKTSKIDRLEKAIDVVNEHEGINFEKEVDTLELDFPQNPEDKIIGDGYLMNYGKFRGKKFGEVETSGLIDYFDLLEQRINKPDHSKAWELELYNALKEYLGDINA